ncbi:3'-5' exonuclease [Patescibacteria group bacterium]|nr:3'-5' exonuclease [Patescibacteria group bacterium]
MLGRDLVVLDLEATGKNPDTCSIIQMGCCIIDREDLAIIHPSGFNEYILPYTDIWEQEAAKVHHIGRQFLHENGRCLGVVLEDFEERLASRACKPDLNLRKSFYLATWGGWDIQVLRRAYQFLDKDYPFSHRAFDVSSFVRLYLWSIGKLHKDKVGLYPCAKALNIDTDIYAEHDAYNDAIVTAKVLIHVLRDIKGQRELVSALGISFNLNPKIV